MWLLNILLEDFSKWNSRQTTSAKVQINYRLRYAHTCTRAAHRKLPMDPCATCSLYSSIVESWRCARGPMERYMAAGQRWTYTCLYCQLLYQYCTRYRCESAWEPTGDGKPAPEPTWVPAWEPAWEPAWKPAWESRASGGVEFSSTGSLWPMSNSEFVEALGNRRL